MQGRIIFFELYLGVGHHHDHTAKNIGVAFFLNIAFTVIELVGGILTNSMAILSDALHDLGDSLSLGLSWYFQKLSKKGRNDIFSYGYRRFSLLGAVVNGMVLLTGSVLILTEAIPRIFQPQSVKIEGMIGLAILGILFNGAAVLKLKKGHSLNEKAVYLHLMEDVLGWIAVLMASIVMFFTEAPFLDPLMSVLITGYVLLNVFRNLKESFQIILQGTPKDIDLNAVVDKIKDLPEVKDIHDCHLWSLDGTYHILTMHLKVNKELSMDRQADIKKATRQLLSHIPIQHATIEFEAEEEPCELENC